MRKILYIKKGKQRDGGNASWRQAARGLSHGWRMLKDDQSESQQLKSPPLPLDEPAPV